MLVYRGRDGEGGRWMEGKGSEKGEKKREEEERQWERASTF